VLLEPARRLFGMRRLHERPTRPGDLLPPLPHPPLPPTAEGRIVTGLRIDLPDELVEAIAQRVAAILADRVPASSASPWLYGAKAAAEYLGWPVGKVEKLQAAGAIPHRRTGRRYVYHRAELDQFASSTDRRWLRPRKADTIHDRENNP
jgi:excisionase family DNA binding protein